MKEVIKKNAKEASVGGRPGIDKDVRAYVNLILRQKDAQEAFKPEMVDGIHLWVELYHLLRCGYPEEAMNLLANHEAKITSTDRAFPGALRAALTSPERRISKAMRDQIASDYNSHIRNSTGVDMYKAALYKIVGRLDLSRKTVKVASTTEDWMWVQLSLIRESGPSDGPQEQYELADLGRMVLKYGADKFDEDGKRPFAWFNLLLYTAQFERVSFQVSREIFGGIADMCRLWLTSGLSLPYVPMLSISV